MIVGIIIAIGLVISMLIFSTQFLPNVISDAINIFIEPFYVMIDKGFLYLAFMLPIICAVIPIYILRNRDEKILVMGAIYGLALMFITVALDLDQTVIQHFESCWTTSWISYLGVMEDVLFLVIYWIAGIFLYMIDSILLILVKLGEPARKARITVRGWIGKWKKKRR